MTVYLVCPCQKYRIYTVYIWFWLTLRIVLNIFPSFPFTCMSSHSTHVAHTSPLLHFPRKLTRTNTHKHTHTNTHKHTHTNTHTHTQAHTYTYARMDTNTHIRICTHGHKHTHTHMHAWTQTHTGTHVASSAFPTQTHAHKHTHLLTRTHKHTHIHICTHGHTYTRTHTQAHTGPSRSQCWRPGFASGSAQWQRIPGTVCPHWSAHRSKYRCGYVTKYGCGYKLRCS